MKVKVYELETVFVHTFYDDSEMFQVLKPHGWHAQYVPYDDYLKQVEINRKLKNTIRKLKRRHNDLYERK